MIKVYKQGITRIIPERDLQKYENFGYQKVDEKHKPEPMVIEEPKGDDAKGDKTKTK